MKTFLNSIKKTNPALSAKLEAAGGAQGALAGTQQFKDAWKLAAQQDRQGFADTQHNFIKQTHYDPVAKTLQKNSNFNLNARSNALKNVMWSMAVQHGTKGAPSIFRNAVGKDNPNQMTDQQLINKLYDQRRYEVQHVYAFKGMSAKARARLRQSLTNRYNREQKNALKMLDQEHPAVTTP